MQHCSYTKFNTLHTLKMLLLQLKTSQCSIFSFVSTRVEVCRVTVLSVDVKSSTTVLPSPAPLYNILHYLSNS